AHGMLVTLAYPYLGIGGGTEGWWLDLTNGVNTSAVCFGFGQYLANGHGIFSGFKGKQNILWVVGGGQTPPRSPAPASGESRPLAILQGLQSAGALQMQTGDWNAPTLATDEQRFAPFMNVNAVYVYEKGHTYGESRLGYLHSPTLPAYLKETGYEGENFIPGDTPSVRKYWWWAILSGCTTGGLYGHRDIWNFTKTNPPETVSWEPGFPFGPYTDWSVSVNAPGAFDMSRVAALISTIEWWKLVPSELTGMKKIVTSANGTQGGDDYVAAAADPGGTLLLAYAPPAGG